MGKGRNGNLLAEFGRYTIVTQLRTAQECLTQSRKDAKAKRSPT